MGEAKPGRQNQPHVVASEETDKETMSTKTACAHCKVVLNHNDYPDGTRSDYWECPDCGCRFWPETVDLTIRNLRDWFAGMALQGLLSNPALCDTFTATGGNYAWFIERATGLADAMLAERERTK